MIILVFAKTLTGARVLTKCFILNLKLADGDIGWNKIENIGGRVNADSLQQQVAVTEKKRARNIGTKIKRLLMHSEDALELRLTWEEAQDLLRPPPTAEPSIVTIEDHEFEEYDVGFSCSRFLLSYQVSVFYNLQLLISLVHFISNNTMLLGKIFDQYLLSCRRHRFLERGLYLLLDHLGKAFYSLMILFSLLISFLI